jgi:Predicted aminoglycoside phosphotransferase
MLSDLVTGDGLLDKTKVLEWEALYKGMGGKTVERFKIRTEQGIASYILKPLNNRESVGREAWVHRSLLHHLPRIKVPKLVDSARHHDPDRYWMIFEDLGPLAHQLSENEIVQAASLIPCWHQLPLSLIPRGFKGNKPPYRDILRQVRRKWEQAESLLLRLGMPSKWINPLRTVMFEAEQTAWSETVVSHGDFHRGNLAVAGGELVVLDWEHAHRNSPFWDLYNLLDLTHPVFRRQTSDALRQSALNAYVASRRRLGWEEPGGFIRSYYEYAAVHSVWLLLLIQDDLKRDVWEPSDLLQAQAETLASLEDCARCLN